MRLRRDQAGVPLARLLVSLARLGDVAEDDGWPGLPVNLTREDLALWIGAGCRSDGWSCRTGRRAGSWPAGTGS